MLYLRWWNQLEPPVSLYRKWYQLSDSILMNEVNKPPKGAVFKGHGLERLGKIHNQ
jgi:hypothetical protein